MSRSGNRSGESLRLTTRVGFGDGAENFFRGYAVGMELAGRETYWSMLSLALGGRRLEPDEIGILDDIAVCSTAADPRIWPLKLVRLLTSYGATVNAYAALCLSLEDSDLGWTVAERACALLLELGEALGEDVDDAERVKDLLGSYRDRGRLPGFGVPLRDRDERLTALTRCVRDRGMARRRYWRLSNTVADEVSRTTGIKPNIAWGVAAVCLDLGFDPLQTKLIVCMVLVHATWANVVEGAGEPSALLRRMPDSVIEYVGPAARISPRAAAAEAGD